MTKYIRRGVRSSLIRVHEVNENQQIIRTHIGKEQIENAIFEQNRNHFKKAHGTNIFKDKIYATLQQDRMRNKILRWQLREEDCDNKEVFEFLKLLVNQTQSNELAFKPITEEDWIREVKRSKKRSISSIFLKKIYSVYKYVLQSQRMIMILVAFYNIFLKESYYPKR